MPIVKHTLDLKKQSELPEQSMKRFDAITENDIDYSDIPDLSDKLLSKRLKAQSSVQGNVKS